MYSFKMMPFPHGLVSNAVRVSNRYEDDPDKAAQTLIKVTRNKADELRNNSYFNIRNIYQGPFSRVLIYTDTYGTEYKSEVFVSMD